MIKSMENTDQDDFFDFLRSVDHPLTADHDFILKHPTEMTGLITDSMIDPFVETGPGKKGSNTLA